MAMGEMKNVAVRGISCALPNNEVLTESFYDSFGTENVDKFIKLSGIRKRYISSSKQTASDLCFSAATKLLENLKWEKESIGALIFITETPDYRLPSTACILQNRLGLSENTIAFDVNLGCSGYVYGLYLVSTLLQSGSINRALLLCGDTVSKFISPLDKSTIMLFGDAGSATALENESGQSIKYLLKTDGKRYKSIIIPAGGCRGLDASRERTEVEDGIYRSDFDFWMDGLEVFNFTIFDVPKAITEFLQFNNLNIEDFDAFIPHQANYQIMNRVAQKSNIPKEKMIVTLDKYGNTSVCSIPLSIVDMCTIGDFSTQKKNMNLLLAGFGVGLSWGVISLHINPKMCLPIIYTDDYYKEENNNEYA